MASKPARLSGIVMISIGVAILLASVGSSAYALINPAWLDQQIANAGPALQDNPLLQPPAITWVIVISGLLGVIESGLSIILGVLVYRGRHWAIATSIVLSVLRLLIIGLLLLLLLLASALAPEQEGMTRDLLFAGGLTLVLLALIGLLIAALRTPPSPPALPSRR